MMKRMEQARRLLEKHGLGDWQFLYENLSNPRQYADESGNQITDTWGLCDLKRKTIAVHTSVPNREFRQTVLHEIAHALRGECDPNNVHDRKWVDIALSVGCTAAHVIPYSMMLRQNGLDRPR